MKLKYILIPIIMFASLIAKGQITINQSNFPFRSKISYQRADSITVPGFNTGTGNLWDLGSIVKKGGRREMLFTQVSNHNTFTQANEMAETWEFLGPLPTRRNVFYKKDATGYQSLGISYNLQKLSLKDFSGNAADSITFPTQSQVFSQPVTEFPFPLTYNTQWTSSVKIHTDFIVDILLLGFNNTPCYYDRHLTATNKVISHGTSRVPAKSAPGNTFNVLLVKTEETWIDSFYINNQPADPFLLISFGLNQGDTIRTYKYRILRENAGMQELAIIEFDDDTYTNPQKAEYSSEFDALAIKELFSANGITIFPNPAKNEDITVTINAEITALEFTLIDLVGRQINCTVQKSGENKYTISGDFSPGIYFLDIISGDNSYATKLVVE